MALPHTVLPHAMIWRYLTRFYRTLCYGATAHGSTARFVMALPRSTANITTSSSDSRPQRKKEIIFKVEVDQYRVTAANVSHEYIHLQTAFWYGRFVTLPCGRQLLICIRLSMKRENYPKLMAVIKLLKLASFQFWLLQLLVILIEIMDAMEVFYLCYVPSMYITRYIPAK